MDRMAARILFSALAIFAPVHLFGQEVFLPFMVEGPRISKTAFTNLERIELTYTVRWMDGYEPIMAELKPQAMVNMGNFGILVLDPAWAEKADIKNERKFEKENFFDITYHLRYMGEKKGEIPIAGTKFPYREVVKSGDSQVLYFPTSGFLLAYGTVLTSDAEDIKEEFDLGSYQTKAALWKVSAVVVILVGVIGSLILVFFKPVPAPLAVSAAGTGAPQAADARVDPAKVINELKINIANGNAGAVCNGLRDMICIYVSGAKPSMPSKDMTAPILSIPHEWERNQLLRVHTALCDIEDHLFVGGDNVNGKVKYHMSHLPATIQALSPWSVYWRRRLFNLKRKKFSTWLLWLAKWLLWLANLPVKLFSYLVKLRHWRRP